VGDFLGEDFHGMRVEALTPDDASVLASFLSVDRDRCALAERKAAGNPYFLEEYCRSSNLTVIPERIRISLSSSIAKLPRRTRRVAEALSLFDQPVDWNVLSDVTGTPEVELRTAVAELERLGLTRDTTLAVGYPDARMLLKTRIPRSKRAALHVFSLNKPFRESCLKLRGVCTDNWPPIGLLLETTRTQPSILAWYPSVGCGILKCASWTRRITLSSQAASLIEERSDVLAKS
jgi:hypothetical protein